MLRLRAPILQSAFLSPQDENAGRRRQTRLRLHTQSSPIRVHAVVACRLWRTIAKERTLSVPPAARASRRSGPDGTVFSFVANGHTHDQPRVLEPWGPGKKEHKTVAVGDVHVSACQRRRMRLASAAPCTSLTGTKTCCHRHPQGNHRWWRTLGSSCVSPLGTGCYPPPPVHYSIPALILKHARRG